MIAIILLMDDLLLLNIILDPTCTLEIFELILLFLTFDRYSSHVAVSMLLTLQVRVDQGELNEMIHQFGYLYLLGSQIKLELLKPRSFSINFVWVFAFKIEIHFVPNAAMHDNFIWTFLIGVDEVEAGVNLFGFNPNDVIGILGIFSQEPVSCQALHVHGVNTGVFLDGFFGVELDGEVWDDDVVIRDLHVVNHSRVNSLSLYLVHQDSLVVESVVLDSV